MDRAEAIKTLTGLLDAFDQDEHGDYFYDNGWAVCEATIISHAALREQEQREQGCEFCKEDKDGFRTMAGAFSLSEPYHGGRYYLNCGKAKVQRVHYCPMCGRKLKKGAEG